MSSLKKQIEQYKKQRQKRLRRKLLGPSPVPPNTRIVQDLPAMERMSEVLHAFVEPYMVPDMTIESLKKLLSVGAIAWNVAPVPRAEREEIIRQSEERLPAEMRQDFRDVLDSLIERKLQHFADNRRAILKFDVTMRANGPFLNVMSSLAV